MLEPAMIPANQRSAPVNPAARPSIHGPADAISGRIGHGEVRTAPALHWLRAPALLAYLWRIAS